MKSVSSLVIGCGGYLPQNRLSNQELSKTLDTSHDWIVKRTGIEARHIAAQGELTSHLALEAGREAIQDAGVAASTVDLVVLATSTPDNTFPATAVSVQHQLGITKGAAFDIQAVCAGFVFALATANAYIKAGLATRVLVIGAETFSRILDWQDRTTCVLFGDGAGALLLDRVDEGAAGRERGILATALRSDGEHKDKLYVDGGPSSTQTSGHVRMKGREVFRFAVGMITDVVEDVLKTAGLTIDDLDWFVPHQANRRIIEASAVKLGIPADKIIFTVQEHGNTSAASIPLALNCVYKDNKIKPGDLVLLEAIGGGFTWGAVLLRW